MTELEQMKEMARNSVASFVADIIRLANQKDIPVIKSSLLIDDDDEYQEQLELRWHLEEKSFNRKSCTLED